MIWYDAVDASSARVLLAGGRLYKAAEPRGWDLVCVKSNTKWLTMIVVFFCKPEHYIYTCRMVNKDTIYMYVPPESSLIPTTHVVRSSRLHSSRQIWHVCFDIIRIDRSYPGLSSGLFVFVKSFIFTPQQDI